MTRFPRIASSQFLRDFFARETAGGIVMIAVAALAILLANSPLSESYTAFITAPLTLHMDASGFVKDVLMAIFFFAIGMELKCEMREGALAEQGQKLLPLVAALGGIIVPALLYLAVTHAHPEYSAGWAIPTATDIAFALCIVRLLGPRIPQAAIIFLLAIAIYDDLAAILIIALFYSSGIALPWLAAVAVLITALAILNRLHVSRITPYLLLGALLWFAVHHAGIHPTIAGVITGLMLPMRTRSGEPVLASLLHRLHPYVAFAILPLFAFTTAGIDLRTMPMDQAFSALPVGIALALFAGKQLGIFAATLACVKSGFALLPQGMNWRLLYGIAILAGIGFTMSLFIGKLAFTSGLAMDEVKLGVIAGSLISALWGLIFLRLSRNA